MHAALHWITSGWKRTNDFDTRYTIHVPIIGIEFWIYNRTDWKFCQSKFLDIDTTRIYKSWTIDLSVVDSLRWIWFFLQFWNLMSLAHIWITGKKLNYGPDVTLNTHMHLSTLWAFFSYFITILLIHSANSRFVPVPLLP